MIKARITQDVDPESPRGWDNLGTIVTWHSRYALGDETSELEPSDFRATLPKDAIVFPIYLMDHSGLSVSTRPFGCPWDSGLLGFIYATSERITEHFGAVTTDTRVDACTILIREIEVLNDYLQGNVWGYVISEATECECCGQVEEVEVDSCWGFYGDSALKAMKEHVDAEHRDALNQAWSERN